MSKKRKPLLNQNSNSLFKKYSFEIKVVFLLTLGVFLLIEDLEIKKHLFIVCKNIMLTLLKNFIKVRDIVLELVKKFEVSDLVGISIIMYVMYLIANRLRERVVHQLGSLDVCPKCKGALHRIRKSWNHKIMGYIYFLKIKNYQCKICNFKGIKIIK